jgi:hypothetical protein
MYFSLPKVINPMYIQKLREMVPSPSQSTVEVCNPYILLTLYYTSSRLVKLLKIFEATVRVPDIFYLTVSLKLINFSFQIFLLFSLKCLLASCVTLFRLSMLLWFGSSNHCILACVLRSKNLEHSSSNHGLCFSLFHRAF